MNLLSGFLVGCVCENIQTTMMEFYSISVALTLLWKLIVMQSNKLGKLHKVVGKKKGAVI